MEARSSEATTKRRVSNICTNVSTWTAFSRRIIRQKTTTEGKTTTNDKNKKFN